MRSIPSSVRSKLLKVAAAADAAVHEQAARATFAGEADPYRHPEAEAEIRGRFGAETTPQRLKMGEFPVGSEIIPNPVNRIAGFSIRNHHFVPGFPQMAWPMVEWVLDERYRHLHNTGALKEESIVVFEAGEGNLADLMYAIEAKWKKLKLFSLPTMGQDGSRGHIELGVRGDPDEVKAAMDEIRAEIARRGHPFRETL